MNELKTDLLNLRGAMISRKLLAMTATNYDNSEWHETRWHEDGDNHDVTDIIWWTMCSPKEGWQKCMIDDSIEVRFSQLYILE